MILQGRDGQWFPTGASTPSPAARLSRRTLLAAMLAVGARTLLPVDSARAAGALPRAAGVLPEAVHPRDEWAAGLPPRGALHDEAIGDVRFLLVHHSATTNTYEPGDVPAILRSFARHHMSNKGWPDIAYNFLVDRYGAIWEGRAGSTVRPVKGDATGGSQGFALLACFIGDHSREAPTIEAVEAMAALLAALGHTYGIDTRPGARASFRSRGSNLHPPGTVVTTATVAGHRDMSNTSCPGDAAYTLVTDALPARVAEVRRRLSGDSDPPTPATRAARRVARRQPPIWPDRIADRTP